MRRPVKRPIGCDAVVDPSCIPLPSDGRFGWPHRFKITAEATCGGKKATATTLYYEGPFNVLFDAAAKDRAADEVDQELSMKLGEMCVGCQNRKLIPTGEPVEISYVTPFYDQDEPVCLK